MQTPATARTGPAAITPAYRWSVVGILCLGVIVAYFDRVNLSVALADTAFKNFFKLSDTDRGLLGSVFFWTYAALQIPAGWVVDRYGVKVPVAISFLVWSVIAGMTAFATSLRELLALRLLLGAGESLMIPGGMRWIRYNCKENDRGLAIGLLMAAAKLGPGWGAPVAAWLIGRSDWRMMFIIIGFGSLLWLIPYWFMMRNDDREIEAQAVKAASGPPIPFLKILASPVIWGTIVGTFCYQYFVYYCLTWMPTYFKEEKGLSLDKSSWFTFAAFTGMAVVATLAGFAADRLIDRGYNAVNVRKGFTIAGFVMATTELIGAYSDSPEVSIFFAIFSLSGLGLMTANYWALTQTLIPGAAIGRIVGVQNCAANLPGVVAPLLTGWLKETTGSFTAPMLAICFFLALGICSYLFVVRPKYAPQFS
ncbi:MAG: MFS transporter [Acidobacteria bacterium]|nr:MFS transporter [Acidobacteriota bacterium]